jgi:hypothetical protein
MKSQILGRNAMKMIMVAALFCLTFSHAASATNAVPLGLELGVASYSQVNQQIGGKTSLANAGTNKYSGGKMLQGNGEGLGIDGLSELTFIFDQSDKLAAVLMTLRKDSFQKTLNALSAKYKLIAKEVPFVGDASAKLQQGDSVIEISSPHMSFEMTVSYMTKGLKQAFTQKASSERATKEKRQADMF